MIVALANTTYVRLLQLGANAHIVSFQNESDTDAIYLKCFADQRAADAYIAADGDNNDMLNEFLLPAASVAGQPTTLLIQASGNDQSTVNRVWYAWQNSGGAMNIRVTQW